MNQDFWQKVPGTINGGLARPPHLSFQFIRTLNMCGWKTSVLPRLKEILLHKLPDCLIIEFSKFLDGQKLPEH